jgi:hypothetical protein
MIGLSWVPFLHRETYKSIGNMNILISNGIRSRDYRVRSAEDQTRLRPCGHLIFLMIQWQKTKKVYTTIRHTGQVPLKIPRTAPLYRVPLCVCVWGGGCMLEIKMKLSKHMSMTQRGASKLVRFNNYYYGGQIKKDKMVGPCSTH